MKQTPIKNKLVTIALATRGRIKDLIRFLDSVKTTTIYPQNIEVILGVDYDDADLKEIISITKMYPFDILVMVQRRSPNISDDYINRMFAAGKGRWLWVMNDDVEIRSNAWDVMLIHVDDKGRPLCIDTLDNTRNYNNNGEFACFPMMNRIMFNRLGYFFTPLIPTWGADKWLCSVVTEAGCVLRMHEIEVFHHMDNEDAQHFNMRHQSCLYGTGVNVDIEDDVRRLR